MAYGIRIIGTPHELWEDEDHVWLESYDPDAHAGQGEIVATPEPEQAMKFGSALLAMQAYRQVSKVQPKRMDGKPNRPLTAFSVSVQEVK